MPRGRRSRGDANIFARTRFCVTSLGRQQFTIVVSRHCRNFRGTSHVGSWRRQCKQLSTDQQVHQHEPKGCWHFLNSAARQQGLAYD